LYSALKKTSNALSTSRQNSQKMHFQVTPENAKTQRGVTKTVWQQIPASHGPDEVQ